MHRIDPESRRILRVALPALTVCLVFAGVLLVIGVNSDVEVAKIERAPGLNAEALPDGIDRAPAPNFDLTDAVTGKRVDLAGSDGKVRLVTFLYTYCPDVCILMGADIRDALKEMGEDAGQVDAFAVSVDPPGDTPERVQDWLKTRRMPANFRYLIGTEDELRPVWREWFVLPQDQKDLNVSTHTASIWLIDKEGRFRAKYSGGKPIDSKQLAEDLSFLVRES